MSSRPLLPNWAWRRSTLDLLGVMFGKAITDWSGAKSIDSDMRMACVEVDTLGAAPSPLKDTDYQLVPAAHSPQASQREEKMFAMHWQNVTL